MTLAAALTDFQMDFIDGLTNDAVVDKALPTDTIRKDFGPGIIGSWRAHINAIQRVVAQNLSSALIMEDDLDWDVRIKDQLTDFAAGVRALTQPLKGNPNKYVDPTFVSRKLTRQFEPLGYDLTPSSAPVTAVPTLSPYGDNWDVLWLGHCGVGFSAKQSRIPKGRYIIRNDETVPAYKYFETLSGPMLDEIKAQYKEHTRIIHHAAGPICTFAYAVSQRGARKILQEIGIDSFTGPIDNLLQQFCERHTCLVSQPQYFSTWRAAGHGERDSDLNEFSKGKFREEGFSENIRQSVRLNSHYLIDGRPPYRDQYSEPDVFL